MKTIFNNPRTLLAGAALLLASTVAEARNYGVSTSSAGRGTKVTTSRGGEAYVGPRGVAAKGANGGVAAAGRYGAAAVGPNGGVAAAGRYGGAAAVGPNGNVYARPTTLPAYGASAVVVRPPTTVVVAPMPAGYIRVVPVGYTTVVYGGYSCRYVGGIYYRPIMYQGSTVYIVVR
ncbi:MAG: hypothetical protein RLZZ398_225 [Verrucomicrobiota bacterium]|jgi:hypothetical protein